MPVREPADVLEGAVTGDFIRQRAYLFVGQERRRLCKTQTRRRHESETEGEEGAERKTSLHRNLL